MPADSILFILKVRKMYPSHFFSNLGNGYDTLFPKLPECILFFSDRLFACQNNPPPNLLFNKIKERPSVGHCLQSYSFLGIYPENLTQQIWVRPTNLNFNRSSGVSEATSDLPAPLITALWTKKKKNVWLDSTPNVKLPSL